MLSLWRRQRVDNSCLGTGVNPTGARSRGKASVECGRGSVLDSGSVKEAVEWKPGAYPARLPLLEAVCYTRFPGVTNTAGLHRG